MKKILAILLLALSTGAMAHGHWHGGHRGGYYNNGYHGGWYRGGWVAPALVGGVIGYELARPYYTPPVVVEQQPVIIQQAPMYVQPTMTTQPANCTAWTETRNPDGTVTVTRTCSQ